MRTIEKSAAFKRDYKRESKGQYRTQLDDLILPTLRMLASDEALPERYRDHNLHSNWEGWRECHLKPDLLLIYQQSEMNTLRLARLGSHSKLFD